jgi:hypothetical protein
MVKIRELVLNSGHANRLHKEIEDSPEFHMSNLIRKEEINVCNRLMNFLRTEIALSALYWTR